MATDLPSVLDQQRRWLETSQKAGACWWKALSDIAQLNLQTFGAAVPAAAGWLKANAPDLATGQPGSATPPPFEGGAYVQQLVGILSNTQAEIGRLVLEQTRSAQSGFSQSLAEGGGPAAAAAASNPVADLFIKSMGAFAGSLQKSPV